MGASSAIPESSSSFRVGSNFSSIGSLLVVVMVLEAQGTKPQATSNTMAEILTRSKWGNYMCFDARSRIRKALSQNGCVV